MNSLSHHIECLLLDHECVVVPHFGAFVTMDCASTRVEAEELFFPPLRVVRFNPDLIEDDGLLVESVRATLHLGETEAKREIQKMVLELRQQLLSDGQVDFGSLGNFTQDDDGHVGFSACQAGAVTPCLFGLDAFSMPRLSTIQRTTKKPSLKVKETDSDDAETIRITLRFSRRAIRYVTATAAVLLMGILFATSTGDLGQRSNQASLLPPTTEQTAPVVAKPITEKVGAIVKEEVPKAEAQTPEQTEEIPAPVQEEPEKVQSSSFVVVLASNISQKNAERYANDLQMRGFSNARILDNGKMLRVVLDGYQTESEAYQQKVRLNQQGREFADVWVMKL
ncbi:MAG: SPOR domain-containing protein [Bacteroidaceae bacterium]|nr:SPOR domain-containing protein [Bacteroidaceae bacterium]